MKKSIFAILALAAILGIVVSAGCIANEQKPAGNSTEPFGSWVLESNKDITLIIEKDNVGGCSGLNLYGGSAEVGDGKIKLGDMISTLLAGPEDVMKAESDYMKALSNATGYKVEGDKLILTDKDGAVLLKFDKTPEIKIEGSSWANDDKIIIRFTEEGRLSGNAPVNLYFGNYTTSGEDKISFSDIGTTKMAGPEEEMIKERAFFAALANVSEYKIIGEFLKLNDKDGNTLLEFKYAEMTIM